MSSLIHLGRPGSESLGTLATRVHDQPTSSPLGLLQRPLAAGFRRDVWRRSVTRDDFAEVRGAIADWAGHRAAGFDLWPARPPLVVGEVVAMGIPLGPLSFTAVCRIITVVDEADQFGFTYATLPHHPEDGEESFIVTRDEDGSVEVAVTAVHRPAWWVGRCVAPMTRWVQNRVNTRYLDGFTAARPLDRCARNGRSR